MVYGDQINADMVSIRDNKYITELTLLNSSAHNKNESPFKISNSITFLTKTQFLKTASNPAQIIA